MVWAYGAQSWGYGTNGLNKQCLVPQSSSVETEGKRLLNLQGHCSPRKAVPSETVLSWEEQGAEEREGRGGAFIFSSFSESLLISDLKSSACVSVLVEVTWDSSSQRPFLQNTKGEESPSTFLSGNLQGDHDIKNPASTFAWFQEDSVQCCWEMNALEMLPRATASDSKWKLCFSLFSIRMNLLDPEEFIEVLMRGIWILLSGLLERLTFSTNVKKRPVL